MGQQESMLDKVSSAELHEIGAGGYGEVFTSQEYKEYAVKISKESGCRRDFVQEFEIQRTVHEEFRSQFRGTKTLKFLDVVRVDEIGELRDGKCAIIMERICPLDNPPVDELSGKTAHAMLGDFDSRVTYHGKRGVFVGNQLLGNLISLPGLADALGRFMAFMHFYLKLDAEDLEFIIGTRCASDKVMVFVLDFGMVQPMGENMDIKSSLWALPYFPIACEGSCQTDLMIKGKLVEIFWRAYIDQASKYGDYEKAAVRNLKESSS